MCRGVFWPASVGLVANALARGLARARGGMGFRTMAEVAQALHRRPPQPVTLRAPRAPPNSLTGTQVAETFRHPRALSVAHVELSEDVWREL